MRKVLTFGVFDYFHLGHLRLFKQAKENGDFLIVAVQDGKFCSIYKPNKKLYYSTEERVELVSALRIVDEAIVYDHVGIDVIKNIDFDILCLGEDHIGERFDKVTQWCYANGKKVVRLKRTPGISSTELKSDVERLK